MSKKFSCIAKPYVLEFKKPAKTSRDTMTERKIWLLELMDNFGRDGFGEIAPLPGLSLEYNDKFEDKINEVCENINFYLENRDMLIEYPSILFGLETAWMSYKHRDFIFYKTPFTHNEKNIPINALIWMGDSNNMKAQIDKALTKGAKCIKLKIGGIKIDEEISLLKYIRNQKNVDEVSIRLDANGAFKPEEALDIIKELAQYDIHSIEQPIAASQYYEMLQITQKSPIPIALDEDLIGLNSYKQKCALMEQVQPQYIVLKPSLHGGFRGCEEWIFVAKSNKVKWWLTSALESSIGLNALAQWASQYEEAYTFHQGLGTGKLYNNNFPSHLKSKNYQLRFQK